MFTLTLGRLVFEEKNIVHKLSMLIHLQNADRYILSQVNYYLLSLNPLAYM